MAFLRLVVLALVLLAGCTPAQEPVRSLTILHLNDLHARLLPDSEQRGGFAHVAEAIRRERAESEATLVMHGGDLVQGSPVSTIFQGVPVYEVANSLGLDFHTLGNHEFDYGWEKIPEFIETATFTTVSANIADDLGNLLIDSPYVIREINGIRVAVIGILTADLEEITKRHLRGPWRALPVVETVQRYVNEIGERADLIVVLSHIFPFEEDKILRENPGVPVIISGHHHGGQDEIKEYDGRVCVKTRPYGRELGRLDLRFDVKEKRLVSYQWRRIPVDARKLAPVETAAKLVEKWEAQVSEVVDVPIGESRREFSRQELQSVIERVMAQTVGADIAFMNHGGIRDSLPQGPLLARHVWNILPFDNLIVTGRVPGEELKKVLTDGREIDERRDYVVATNDFVAEKWRERGLPFAEQGPLLRDVMIDWIRSQRVVQ